MHQLTVIATEEESHDVVRLSIKRPEGFDYVAGQFVVLQLPIRGKPVRRSYSLASAPHQESLEVAVKRQEGGTFSPALCDLKPGETIGLLGPFGQFILPGDDRPIIMYAAGTGITPFMSFLRHLAESRDERQVILIDSNRRPEDILYSEELESLSRQIDLTVHHTITRPETGWEGLTGRIREELLKDLKIPLDAWHYLCGSTPMVTGVKECLISMGAQKEMLRTEKFGNILA